MAVGCKEYYSWDDVRPQHVACVYPVSLSHGDDQSSVIRRVFAVTALALNHTFLNPHLPVWRQEVASVAGPQPKARKGVGKVIDCSRLLRSCQSCHDLTGWSSSKDNGTQSVPLGHSHGWVRTLCKCVQCVLFPNSLLADLKITTTLNLDVGTEQYLLCPPLGKGEVAPSSINAYVESNHDTRRTCMSNGHKY